MIELIAILSPLNLLIMRRGRKDLRTLSDLNPLIAVFYDVTVETSFEHFDRSVFET